MIRRFTASVGVLAGAGALVAGMAMPAGASARVTTAPGVRVAAAGASTVAEASATVTPSALLFTVRQTQTCVNGRFGVAGIKAQTRVTEFGRSGIYQLGNTYKAQVLTTVGWRTFATRSYVSSTFPNDARSFYKDFAAVKYTYKLGDIGGYFRFQSTGRAYFVSGAVRSLTVTSTFSCHPV